MKFSVRTSVILIPLIVGSICAMYAYRTRLYEWELTENYRQDLSDGLRAEPTFLLRHFGEKRFAEFLNHHRNVDVRFDGQNRWVHIFRVPVGIPGRSVACYEILSLKHGLCRIVYLPTGASVDSVAFDKEDLVFTIHGEIVHDELFTGFPCQYGIPADAPEEYRLHWPVNSPIPQSSVESLMIARHCDSKLNKVDSSQ